MAGTRFNAHVFLEQKFPMTLGSFVPTEPSLFESWQQVLGLAYMGPTGYVPAPSDTQAAFRLLGGNSDLDMQWQSFMNQLGMYMNDPAAPHPPLQMKLDYKWLGLR